MATRNFEIKVPFGVIESDGIQLQGIKEKPTFDVMINAGIYMLDPEIISTLDKSEIQITTIFFITAGSKQICALFSIG